MGLRMHTDHNHPPDTPQKVHWVGKAQVPVHSFQVTLREQNLRFSQIRCTRNPCSEGSAKRKVVDFFMIIVLSGYNTVCMTLANYLTRPRPRECANGGCFG